MEELKPCPFCGSTNLAEYGQDGEIHWFQCNECGCELRSKKSRREAITAWNRRTPESSDGFSVKKFLDPIEVERTLANITRAYRVANTGQGKE